MLMSGEAGRGLAIDWEIIGAALDLQLGLQPREGETIQGELSTS